MIRSMTAFARAESAVGSKIFEVEMRSINHRHFDCSLKLPALLDAAENDIRDWTQQSVSRGKITITVKETSREPGGADLTLDEAAAKRYLDQIRKVQKKLGLAGDITVQELIKLPGVFSGQNGVSRGLTQAETQAFKTLYTRSLKALLKARETEGKKLAEDILKRLQTMAHTVKQVEALAEGRAAQVLERLRKRLQEITAGAGMDEDRLYRESVLLAEKSDVTEEIVRLRSHFDLFEKKIRAGGQAGRELDFLCQEMHREVNTIGSKSQQFEVSREVVFLKGEIEKIREQVQNVE